MSKSKLFITTKNLDYIRNVQEIKRLKRECGGVDPDIIGSRSQSYIKRIFTVYIRLFTTKLQNYDEVFIGFAPQLIIPFWKGKMERYRKAGGRITIDFFISVYDTLVCDRKKFGAGTPAARIAAMLDRRTIDTADHIIADTRAHAEYFQKEFGADEACTEVYYLEADTSIYYPHEAVRPEEYKNCKVVLYFASVLPLQGVDIVLDAARLMKDERDIRFVIIGPVRNKVLQNNITYIDWLSQKELSDAIATADLCLAGHFNGDIDKASRTIPGKAYIYKAMEKPMVLGDNPANRELFDESMPGIAFCRMGDAQSLKEAIVNMLSLE